MKKILSILLVSVLCITSVFAQSPRRHHYSYHRSGWEKFDHTLHTIDNVATTAWLLGGIAMFDDYTGLRVGVNSASLRLSGDIGSDLHSEGIGGMDLGVVFGWYLGKSPIILEPGIFLSLKGGELSEDRYVATKYNMTMLEIPLVLKYDLPLADNVAFQPFMGGFMAFGIGGEAKFKDTHDTFDTFGDGGFKSFDAGLRLGCGMCISRFYLELSYDLGLVNLPTSSYEDFYYDDWNDAIKSNCLSLNFGINF